MLSYLPNQISSKAIYLYLGSLVAVSLLFIRYSMSWEYIVMSIVWVAGFFLLTSLCSKKWQKLPEGIFIRNVVLSALAVRILWVIFSYIFYTLKTGMPFEFEAADSIGYWDEGDWLAREKWSYVIEYLFTSRGSVSDSGYVFYLTFISKIFGSNILFTRIIKCLWSTATILLLYLLAKRNIGEEAGRLAAVLACFMPNLIIYCGLHLKETEMLFLLVAYLERADYLLRKKKYNVLTIAVPALLAISLFTFRTVLGAAAVFSFATALVFSSSQVISRTRRIILISWGVLAAFTVTGGTIVNEAEGLWENRFENQSTKRYQQTVRGNKWAKYATGTVMAPMIFILPFPTMVDVDEQYNQQIMSGGNYVRNFLGVFVLLAIFAAIFITKNWRDLSLIGSFAIAYLGIISASGFSNSERFLLPGLPILLIFAASGITQLNAKTYRWVKYWYYVVPIMAVAWAYFKVGSRGLL